MEDKLNEVLKDVLGVEFEPEQPEKDNKEYFTLVYNGKSCKAWIIAPELIPDLAGKFYAQGYLFDGLKHHTIKLYID